MTKRVLTAEQITGEINRRMADCLDVDCHDCLVLTASQATTEDYGGNWKVDGLYGCTRGCIVELSRIVGELRREYDCSDW